jgi:hypothetical protein
VFVVIKWAGITGYFLNEAFQFIRIDAENSDCYTIMQEEKVFVSEFPAHRVLLKLNKVEH